MFGVNDFLEIESWQYGVWRNGSEEPNVLRKSLQNSPAALILVVELEEKCYLQLDTVISCESKTRPESSFFEGILGLAK